MSKSGALLLAVLLLIAGMARAEDKEREPFAILEIGGAGEWGLREGSRSFGPSIAAEFDVIKEWLEIEAGFTPLFSKNYSEWSTDLLFKKPFTLSKTVEFMVGAGPECKYKKEGGEIFAGVGLGVMFCTWTYKSY